MSVLLLSYTSKQGAKNIQEKGLWAQSSAPDVGSHTARQAADKLGIPKPEVVVKIKNGGQFKPNSPPTVE